MTSDTRLAFTKDGFQPYETHDGKLLAIIKVFKN